MNVWNGLAHATSIIAPACDTTASVTVIPVNASTSAAVHQVCDAAAVTDSATVAPTGLPE